MNETTRALLASKRAQRAAKAALIAALEQGDNYAADPTLRASMQTAKEAHERAAQLRAAGAR